MIAMEIMKTARTIGDVNCKKKADVMNNNVATRLICMPGKMPVRVPTIIPSNSAIKICSSML
jgi:hypothetical protein